MSFHTFTNYYLSFIVRLKNYIIIFFLLYYEETHPAQLPKSRNKGGDALKTKPLYYENPYLKMFTAGLVEQGTDEKGRSYAILDQTAFYPAGGGQPGDRGTLNGIEVTDVEKETNGSVRHYLRRPLPDNRARVEGALDWARRFDHMQQHAGQHILSAAFAETAEIRTIAFHMGKNISTIDLDTSGLTDETADKAEQMANWIIFQNQPIISKWVRDDELDRYPLRKRPTVNENIRLVIIEGFDYNPCGGTHPARTGEAGPIKITGWTRDRGHIRLEFVCGWRALRLAENEHHALQRLTALFQTNADDLDRVAEKRLEDYHTLEQECRRLREQVLAFEAGSLAAQSEEDGKLTVIARVFDERPMKECRKLAGYIVERHSKCTVLFVIKSGARLQLVCARGADVGIDMNALVKQSLPMINGKGGGSANAAQGAGAANLSAEEMLDCLKTAIAEIREK